MGNRAGANDARNVSAQFGERDQEKDAIELTTTSDTTPFPNSETKDFGIESTKDISPTKPKEKGEAPIKEGNGKTGLEGWTIMRPFKLRGMGKKKTNGGVVQAREEGRESRSSEDVDKKGLKGMKSNATTETTGELERATDMRSDDELLDDAEDGLHVRTRCIGVEQRVGGDGDTVGDNATGASVTQFKVYKRRWFGLVQLVLLNIVVSWDWLSFSASSKTASSYYNVSESQLNWLATAFLFAFVLASPFVAYTLHRGGPKPSIVTASILLLLGNWIRYGATRSGSHGNFGGVMFGQILTGIAQPFVLAAPTRYSDMWFTNRGRVAATAVMSLSNPLGGALAQLVGPFWTSQPSDVPNLVLYISIIATIASIPSFFIPAYPPTPCSYSGTTPKRPLMPSIKLLFTSPEFYMIFIPFIILVGLFNSCSSLINQILEPYGFSEDEAGIAGALLICVGLLTSAVTSPIIDKTKTYLLAIKLQVPIVALAYLAFTWAPQTRTVAGPYAILAILGAASFSLVPVVLEYLIEITHPVSPEVTSTICWSGGQLLGGIFIIVSDALRDSDSTSPDDRSTRPPGNMWRALVFQTVFAMVAVPWPLCLGLFGRRKQVSLRRVEADRERERVAHEGSEA